MALIGALLSRVLITSLVAIQYTAKIYCSEKIYGIQAIKCILAVLVEHRGTEQVRLYQGKFNSDCDGRVTFI